jgi:LmbE family N-acetylglucosaminyl deacetylase
VPGDASLAVISPHLDDAVLGCGDLLAERPGVVVVTAFAGRPDGYPELTSWDARAGFAPGADVVAARHQEDRAARAGLGARPHWLELPDRQYGARPARAALADALARTLDDLAPTVVDSPLGSFHDDHIVTGATALDVLRRRAAPSWVAYADAIY